MAKKIKIVDYLVPFDSMGNQLHYPDYGCNMRPNFIFEGVIKITGMSRGYSAAYFLATDIYGMRYSMFMKDLCEALPYIERGLLRGKFTFTKRGQNFGVRYLPTDGALS